MKCEDKNCPHCGTLATRGISFEGTVISDKMQSTVIVSQKHVKKNRKYERYERFNYKIPVHASPCMNVSVGDDVRIMECRKLAKTVSFVVVENLSKKTDEEPPVEKEKKTKKK